MMKPHDRLAECPSCHTVTACNKDEMPLFCDVEWCFHRGIDLVLVPEGQSCMSDDDVLALPKLTC